MPEIVDADAIEPGAGSQTPPRSLKVGRILAVDMACNHIWIARQAGQVVTTRPKTDPKPAACSTCP